ncbi:MAG: hypothetical protein QMD50_02910 [Patescibacteria group bacterium]|nr:hypothetical protein [Patescibacteria group bacterium]
MSKIIRSAKIAINSSIIASCFLLSSCYMKELRQSLEDAFWWRSYETIIKRPVSLWNRRDCLTVMMENIQSNILDMRTNIKVYATPYNPTVIAAMSKFRWLQIPVHQTEAESNFEALLKDNFGMYYDWNHQKIMDSRGNYFKDKTQIDSIMFLITIENYAWITSMTWPQLLPQLPDGKNITNIALDIPDITHLEDQIYLINEQNKFIKPKYVWGKKRNVLTMPETLLAMFEVKTENYSFLEKSEKIFLCIKGLEQDIKLEFSLKNFEVTVQLR